MPTLYLPGGSIMDELSKKAREFGIDVIGITHSEPFMDSYDQLLKIKNEDLYPKFAETDLKLRTKPKMLMPGVKSIISAAIAYKTIDPDIKPHSGLLSRYAWGQDYHKILSKRLERFAMWMQKTWNVQSYLIAIDTKPTIDRAIFLRAGLGWVGKNCCVFSSQYGSWIFLGSIFTDVKLPSTNFPPQTQSCPENCNLCLKACPTNALFAPYQINPHICISYLTQMKGFIPRELRSKIGTNLWGCDICQQVCPANKKSACGHDCFLPLESSSVEVIPLLNITKKEFNRHFGSTPIGWAGKSVLQRNAAIVCGNLKLTDAVDELAISLSNPNAIVRAAAAWALGEINTKKARDVLTKSLARESDLNIISELEYALTNRQLSF